MRKRFFLIAGVLVGSLIFAVTRAAGELPTAEEEAKATAVRDEEMLRKAGLSTETKDLIAWLKARSEDDADLGRIDELIKQLSFTDKDKREAAQHKLVVLGLNAWPQIIKAAKSSDATTQLAAKACMEEIEKEHHAFLNLATVRLLVYRKEPLVVEALLRYLPFTVDERVEEEIYYGLDALGFANRSLHKALLTALKDELPARRAVAGCIIGRVGNEDQKALVRKLMDDKDSWVRLRCAQGLLASKDKAAVLPLIKLLSDPSFSVAWQAEELLQYLAGNSAPKVVVGKDVEAKAANCSTAWASWWKDHENSCDFDEPARMGRQAGLLLFATCDQDQLSKGTVWLCGCNAQPVPLVYGLHYPWHVEWLKTGQFLLGDFDTLSIRLSTGEVTWEMKVPMSQSYAATDNVNPVCRHRYPLRIYVIVHR